MIDGSTLYFFVTVFVLTIFLGFSVISKVPTTLHTPLMSATNAIHGVVLAGAIVVTAGIFGEDQPSWWMTMFAILAVALGTINVVGGFAVTERMLQMFRKRGGPTR